MNFMKIHNFREVFGFDSLTALYSLEEENNNSDFVFLNKRMEKYKKAFIESIVQFKNLTMPNTFTVSGTLLQVLPNVEIGTQAEKDKNRIILQINDMAHNVCKKYDKLIKKGNRKLF